MQTRKEYNTRQKQLIFELLQTKQGEHVNAEQILGYLRQNRNTVGLTTVYRHLDRLVQDGVLIKYVGLDSMSASYQYVGDTTSHKDHYHLVCLQCGQMIHLSCELIDQFTAHIQEVHRFELNSIKTVFYGYCQQCSVLSGTHTPKSEESAQKRACNCHRTGSDTNQSSLEE